VVGANGSPPALECPNPQEAALETSVGARTVDPTASPLTLLDAPVVVRTGGGIHKPPGPRQRKISGKTAFCPE